MKQQKGDRCECADDLNFGEPQPDCSRCGGTGYVTRPEGDTGPIFNFPREPKATKTTRKKKR